MTDEVEITITPDGKTEIKVIRSNTDCHSLTKPLEQALGKVAETKAVHNPGIQSSAQIRR